MTVMIVTYQHKVCFFTHITSYSLEQPSIVSTAVNESILSPLSKQSESFTHHVRQDARQLPTDGLAWLSLTCPDLGADHRLKSHTYKSHRYASRLKQYKGTALQQTDTHSQLFLHYT